MFLIYFSSLDQYANSTLAIIFIFIVINLHYCL